MLRDTIRHLPNYSETNCRPHQALPGTQRLGQCIDFFSPTRLHPLIPPRIWKQGNEAAASWKPPNPKPLCRASEILGKSLTQFIPLNSIASTVQGEQKNQCKLPASSQRTGTEEPNVNHRVPGP